MKTLVDVKLGVWAILDGSAVLRFMKPMREIRWSCRPIAARGATELMAYESEGVAFAYAIRSDRIKPIGAVAGGFKAMACGLPQDGDPIEPAEIIHSDPYVLVIGTSNNMLAASKMLPILVAHTEG